MHYKAKNSFFSKPKKIDEMRKKSDNYVNINVIFLRLTR